MPVGSPSPKRSTMRSMYGFSLDSKFEQRDYLNLATRVGSSKNNSGPCKTRITGSNLGSRQLSEGNLKESLKRNDLGTLESHPKGAYFVKYFASFFQNRVLLVIFCLGINFLLLILPQIGSRGFT